MRKTLLILFILAPFLSLGQGYLNQTKKYIINEFAECNIFEYTDTTVCLKCKSSEYECFYFNKDGVCDYYVVEYSENATQYLREKLSNSGYLVNIVNRGNTEIFQYTSKFMYVDIKKSKREGYYLCSFY